MTKTKIFLSLILSVLFLSVSTFVKAQKPGKLTVKWSFLHLVEGYDHKCKTLVFIDGEQVGESSVKKESEPNSLTVNTTQGSHKVKIQNYADYEDKWEEHTIANEYSIDCSYEKTIKIKSNSTISLVFDIDCGTLVGKAKCPKVKAKKEK